MTSSSPETCGKRSTVLTPIRPPAKPIYALLDNIRSAWNVGSMFRTADAIPLAGLFLCGVTATPPRPDLEKTALGATLTVPWDYWENTSEAVAALRSRGVQVIALEQTEDAVPHHEFTYTFPLCFVVGHEVRGVSPEVLANVDGAVEIPMSGTKRSLNVAVSFGVLAFEIWRQWQARDRELKEQASATSRLARGD
jgi:tRNA G18 (ribose-2'-O)-methylase SpoU